MKQRLVGAAVLVALAVIFLPMLVQGPAPDSGVSDVPLDVPSAPAGEYEVRDLPLVAPESAPDGGAVGMDSTAPAATATAPEAAPATASPPSPADEAEAPDNPDAAQLASDEADTTAAPPPAPALPPATAGGDYAVSFGSFTTASAADKVIASLRSAGLPGYRESATVDRKPVQRVRIGPYATRADAEIARQQALRVRDDVSARVVALDADGAGAVARSTTKPTSPAPAPSESKPQPATVQAPTTPPPAAASTGFAVQVGAFSKATDAIALRDRLRQLGFSAFTEAVNTDKGQLTRVRAGPVATRAEADQLKAQVKARTGIDGIVRPHP